MRIALIVTAVIAEIILLIMLIPVRALVRFYKNPNGSGLEIAVKIAFLRFRIHPSESKKPSKSKKDKKPKEIVEKPSMTERIKGGIELYRLIADDVKDIISYTAKNAFRFELIRFNFYYGTGDAASTGILFGVISGIVHGLVGIAANYARVDRSEIFITPEFAKTALETDGECIVKLQNVHIMVIAVKLIKLLLKIKKGKERD